MYESSILNRHPTKMNRLLPHRSHPGFALVVALSLLVLLPVIAMGLLSLSAISLRSVSQDQAQAEARANARLALMIAIGELQSLAGADTRVTASADILDPTNPPLLGVWRSWEGSNHDPDHGRPIPPDYPSKRQSASDGGRFLGWLASSSPGGSRVTDAGAAVSTTPKENTVPLLSHGSLGSSDTRQIHITPTPVSSTGNMAWWVSGENQKARLPKPLADSDDASEWAQRMQSHAVADPEPFGLDALLQNPESGNKAISLSNVSLIEPQSTTAAKSFHDLSATSTGLLTNTATGGWRKDLSLLMASWDQQPEQNLALFQITPGGQSSNAARATPANPTPTRGALYPWSVYRPFQTHVFSQQAAVSSWSHLADWMNLYQSMTLDANGRASLPLSSDANILDQTNTFESLHKQRIYPLIARIQWLFYHYSTSRNLFNASNPHLGSGRLRLHLKIMPVVTIWNPYNFSLTVDNSIYAKVIEPIPPAIRYSFDDVPNADFSAVMASSDPAANDSTGYRYDMEFERSQAAYTRMYFQIVGPMTFGPGRSVVFSPVGSAIRGPNDRMIELEPGMRHNPLYSAKVYRDMPALTAAQKRQHWTNTGFPPTTRIHTQVAFDNAMSEEGRIGTGAGIDILAGEDLLFVNDADTELDEVRNNMRGVYARDTAATVMPPVLDVNDMMSLTLSEAHENPIPFMSLIFGLRTANNNHLASRGLVQSSPFANTSRMGLDDFIGSGHPINSSYDFSYALHTSGGDSMLPDVSADGSGFVVSGINFADGLSRCVIAEIPIRPVASLVELNHWDLRFENPLPPFGFNLIGNSDATPLIPSNAVHNDGGSIGGNLQHDDSYCANHLMFDDWFVSAIAPTTATSVGGTRTQRTVFRDYLTGEQPLPTRAYKPIQSDKRAAGSIADANAVFDSHVAPPESWQTIASRIEVEGMFNVNSTSIKAWRALLGHARGQKLPYLDASSQTVLSAGEEDYAHSRFSVSADAQAGTLSPLSGAFPEASEFTGYRVFDDDLLDRLAEEIVNQVRARGPFLSLSEFVNRQLSNDDSLALAGAVQSALNIIQKSGDNNPFAILEARSKDTLADPTLADEEYQYPAAAVGHSNYGVPGWTRQADILRPLAPILSARDDTFTIRAYGDSLAADGKVLATAYCEAVVRRSRDFVDPADAAHLASPPQSLSNQQFGRKFEILSFKWLHPNEI